MLKMVPELFRLSMDVIPKYWSASGSQVTKGLRPTKSAVGTPADL